jgi:haloacetate dehalogenase
MWLVLRGTLVFEGFNRTNIETSGARIHVPHGGDGAQLLLLHGNSPTHVCIANQLAPALPCLWADSHGYGDNVGSRMVMRTAHLAGLERLRAPRHPSRCRHPPQVAANCALAHA